MALSVLTACSPSSFFGNKSDPAVEQAPSYRRIPTQCSQLSLPKATLDNESFKSLLHCFNSDGALEPLDQLVRKMPEQDLAAVVGAINRYVLSNPKRLYELEETFYALEKNGTIQPSFTEILGPLENPDFVVAAARLLESVYESDGEKSRAQVLQLLRKFSTQVTPEKSADALDIGLNLATAKAFASLQSRFKDSRIPDLPGDELDCSKAESTGGRLPDLVCSTHAYFQAWKSSRLAGKSDALELLFSHWAMGDIERVRSDLLGESESDLRKKTARISSILRVPLEENGEMLSRLNRLFAGLDRPIPCLRGSKQVRNGVDFVIQEVLLRKTEAGPQFILRENPLIMSMMSESCLYPPELEEYYSALASLSASRAGVPVAELLQAVNRIERPGAAGPSHPLKDLLIRFVEDRDTNLLTPVLTALNEKDLWEDAILLASLPDAQGQRRAAELIDDLLRADPQLEGKSAYSVIRDLIPGIPPIRVYRLLQALHPYFVSDQPVLPPLLSRVRAALHVNDAHPLVDLVRELLSETEQNRPLFDAFLRASHDPDFAPTIKLIGTLAKDGRLKELVGANVSLFHRFARAGAHEIRAVRLPDFAPARRHDLAARDLEPYSGSLDPRYSACLRLVPGKFPSEQLETWADCLNAEGTQPGIAASLKFIDRHRSEDGRNLLGLVADYVKSFALETSQLRWVLDRWIELYDSGKFARSMQALVPALVRPGSSAETPRSSWVETGLAVLRPVMLSARDEFRRLRELTGRVLKNRDFLPLLDYAEKLALREPPKSAPEASIGFDDPRILRWLDNKECQTLPRDPAQRERAKRIRLQQIRADYLDAVTNGDLVNNRRRTEWSFDDFRNNAQWLVQKLSEPSQVQPGVSLVEGLLDFQRFYSLKPGEKPEQGRLGTPEELARWLEVRSKDPKLVTFFFPGRNTPEVRLMNSLDRLELMMTESDYVAPAPLNTNFSLDFLGKIAEAWGDEEYALWPKEIQDRFAKTGEKPKTLAQVVEELEKTLNGFAKLVGFPTHESCAQTADPRDDEATQKEETRDDGRRFNLPGQIPQLAAVQPSIYNSYQILSILRENLPASKKYGGDRGLRLLRDLFWTMVAHTAPENRNGKAGARNNLSVIVKLGRLGTFRQLSRMMRSLDSSDPMAVDAYTGAVRSSVSPEMRELSRLLFVQDRSREHRLIWSILKPLFHVLDQAKDRPEEKARVGRLAAFTLANLGAMDLHDIALKNVLTLLQEQGDLIERYPDAVEWALRSKPVVDLLQNFYEDSDRDSKGKVRDLVGDEFWDGRQVSDAGRVLRVVLDDEEAREALARFQSSKINLPADRKDLQAMADFFREKGSDPMAISTARQLRYSFADGLGRAEVDQILLHLARYPRDSAQALEAVGHSIERNELDGFFQMIRRTLTP